MAKKFYGVDMQGKLWIEEVSSLPTWIANDERRLLYFNDRLYLGTSTKLTAIIDEDTPAETAKYA